MASLNATTGTRRCLLCQRWLRSWRGGVVLLVLALVCGFEVLMWDRPEGYRFVPPPSLHRSQLVETSTSKDSLFWNPHITHWAHAANSKKKLRQVTSDPFLEAIEADFVMGYDTGVPKAHRQEEAIAGHPPKRRSDLSLRTFLENTSRLESDGSRSLRWHLKLDMKQSEVVPDALSSIQALRLGQGKESVASSNRVVFLNADVFRGPGGARKTPMDADYFVRTCLEYVGGNELSGSVQGRQKYIFSLGYTTDYHSKSGFTSDQVGQMWNLTQNYNLGDLPCCGLVLALNARQLAFSPGAFDEYLANFPRVTILAWTGRGEPGIPKESLQRIIDHFETMEWAHRLGFDAIARDR